MIHNRFVHKWLLEHVTKCKKCSEIGLGLDGKRGMKRFVCASLNGQRKHFQFLGVTHQRPCHRMPLQGSLYCKCHETSAAVDDHDAVDPDTSIVEHRRGPDGDLQYRLRTQEGEGRYVHTWVKADHVAAPLVHAYETNRLPTRFDRSVGKKKKVRRKASSATDAVDAIPCLVELPEDRGACEIDKAVQASPTSHKKWQRRRVGGIIAAVSGCRIFLDWAEHHGGEGPSEVYTLLGNCIGTIETSKAAGGPGRLPDVVFFDNACALRQFALNRRRSVLTAITQVIATLHFMLDIWHVVNHTKCLADPATQPILDPRHPDNERKRQDVNTEACEQAFSYIDRITYVAGTMGPGMFHAYNYLLMDLENQKVMRARR